MPNWTPAQRSAIEARGRTVLVSAAAGSGKTAVLTERVIRRILDPQNPVDADRLLVVTFSNAAAAEMRSRIGARLSELIEADPSNQNLLRQQLCLQRAQICTIHAFCLDLLRRHFQKLEIAPGFRIADPRELGLMREEAAQTVMEQFYREDDGSFSELVELLSTGRDDRRVTDTLFSLYDFIRAHPFYNDWLEEKLRYYDPDCPVAQTVWGELSLHYAAETLRYAAQRLQGAIAAMEDDEKMAAAYLPAFQADFGQVQALLGLVENQDWDGICRRLALLEYPRLGALRGYEGEERKRAVQAARKEARELVEGLRARPFCSTAAEFAQDMRDLRGKVTVLFALARAFDQTLYALKKAKKVLDFSDLEQLALTLLAEKKGEGYCPTPLARELSERYEEIFIDEYQDTNQAQDLLFTAISRQGDNLFLVGDVKQSIYRFRQASPELFMQKKERYAPYAAAPQAAGPGKIILGENFRSRAEVTGAVNFLFGRIMSRRVGEIEYTAEEALVPAASYPPMAGAGVELHLLDLSLSEDAAALCEARYAAGLIAQLLESGAQVTDRSGSLRPVRRGDICILLRSLSGKAPIYLRALADAGVQCRADGQGGYLDSVEVSSLLSLLRAVDNPLLDISLVAAMMSPIFAFSADEMAAVRLCRREGPLYLALTLRAEQDARCAAFLATLAAIRRWAATMPTDRLIRRILEETGFDAMVLAMKQGQARRQNLRLLVRYAADYEQAGYRGLSEFIRLIDRMQERGDDLPAAGAPSGGGDAVQLMSIHRSKGLEFPVVLLCDSSKGFNKEDLRSSTLLHPEIGFACVRRDLGRQCQFSTVPLEAMRLETERLLLSEEMRVLYVALTRARERLLITSAQKDLSAKLRALSCALDEGGRLPAYAVRRCGSYADWMLMAALHHPDGELLRAQIDSELTPLPDPSRLRVVLATPGALPPPAERGAARTALPDPVLLARLREQTAWRYHDPAAAQTPAKLAVTAIVREEEAQAGEERAFTARPAFLQEYHMTAAERGTALHQYMLFADHAAAQKDLPAELRRLCERRFLTEREARAIRLDQVRAYYQSGLARRVQAAPRVWRELRFMTELGAERLGELLPEMGQNKVTVQGIIDLVFEEAGGLVIVDYKTDRVEDPSELIGRYTRQLELYAEVLPQTLGLPVREKILYSTFLAREISV